MTLIQLLLIGVCFFTSPSIIFPPLPPPAKTSSTSFIFDICHMNCIHKATCLGFLFDNQTRRCQHIECEDEGTVTTLSKDSANLMWMAGVKDGNDRSWLRYFGSSDWDEKTLTDPSFVQSAIEAAKKHCNDLPSKTP
ncbi:hypothetical protein PRIPAC_75577 [Pristionchus pacificus]|uniref:Uncharacterized protein n=1 Tax=Pristionchus pacificus TaxID=54126 RepID=A0A2A6CGT7_PRIPA|nr:hypothetical protein PRIPAC_75577 [Pristionchus pacificus]|eukprot:PDM77221.1 hypothetical protein PRIPAC_43133 [Pristionchus pacificus]